MRLEHAYPGAGDDGRKSAAVREAFGVSMTRYVQRLNALLDDPEFIALDPVHARMLRSRRERHQRGRTSTRSGSNVR